jgi:hypothetical protein
MSAKEILESVFTERKKAKIRGRTGIRRPKRATKAGYLGRGYKGKDGGFQGAWQSSEPEAPELPKAPEEPGKKPRITEFDNYEDWMLTMILMAVMHANPGIEAEDAIEQAKEWTRKLYMPRTDHLWRRQMLRIDRFGIRAEASKIRREMYKLI